MSEPNFGLDLSCDRDLDPRGVEVNGFLALAQALARRLDTPNGNLVGDEQGSYGFSLTNLVSSGITQDELRSVPGRVRAQFLDDERVFDAEVKPTFSGDSIRLDCRIVASSGTFSLTLSIDKVSAQIFSVQGAT